MDLHLLIRTLHATVLAPEIGRGMVECAEVAGRFVSPDAYLALVLPQVTGDMDANPSTDVASRHAGLILLAALLRGHPSPPRHSVHLAPQLLQSDLMFLLHHVAILVGFGKR